MSKRILLVDDEPNLLTTLADIFEDEGYEVLTARTGEDALRVDAEHAVDIAVLDLKMPGMTGLETLAALQQQGSRARFVLMSAYAMEDVKREALEHGALAFLDKPLNLEALLDIVRDAHSAAVLIISDDPACAAIATTLKSQGYRVTSAASTRAAVGLAQQIHFKVLIIDCGLATSDGLETYRALKPVAQGADAILLTGDDETERDTARRAIEHTAFAALEKPLAATTLPPMLTRLLGQQLTGERAKPQPFE